VSLFCDDADEHRRQARDDFRRGGPYGYDRERYGNRHGDDCDRAYAEAFDGARREDERRREEIAEDEARDRAEARRAAERAEALMWEQWEHEAARAADYREPEPEPDPPAEEP
jgi:hypothetical protein